MIYDLDVFLFLWSMFNPKRLSYFSKGNEIMSLCLKVQTPK